MDACDASEAASDVSDALTLVAAVLAALSREEASDRRVLASLSAPDAIDDPQAPALVAMAPASEDSEAATLGAAVRASLAMDVALDSRSDAALAPSDPAVEMALWISEPMELRKPSCGAATAVEARTKAEVRRGSCIFMV